MYKVVEGLVPALPPSKFFTPQKQGRRIRTRQDTQFSTSNTVTNFVRNNDKCFIVPTSKTDQHKNRFFVRTVAEWNALDNTTVQATSACAFKNYLGTAIAEIAP